MVNPLYASNFNDTTYLWVASNGAVQQTQKNVFSFSDRLKKCINPNSPLNLNRVVRACKIEEAVNQSFPKEAKLQQLTRMKRNLTWLNTKAIKHNKGVLVSIKKKTKCDTVPVKNGLNHIENQLHNYSLQQTIEELIRRLEHPFYQPDETALFRSSGLFTRIQYCQQHLEEIDFTKEDIHTLIGLLKYLIKTMPPSRKEHFKDLRNQTSPDLLRSCINVLNSEDKAFLIDQVKLLRLVIDKDWAKRVYTMGDPLDAIMIVLTDLANPISDSGLLGFRTLRLLITDKTIIPA